MKPTQAIIRQRVEEILSIRLDGAQFCDVRQYVAEKQAAGEPPWTIPEGGKPMSERTLWRYIAKTDKLIAESCQESRKKLLNRHLAQRKHLYARAVNSGDIRAALSVLRDEAELRGLYPAKGIKVGGPDGEPLLPAVEEIVAALIKAERGGNVDDTGATETGATPSRNGSAPLPR